MSPLASVNRACGMLQQEESQRETLKPIKEGEGLAMMSKGKGKDVTCTACGKKGHPYEKCWTIVGYPSWFEKSKNKEQGLDMMSKGKGKDVTCTACGKKGRPYEKCWTIVGYPSWFDKSKNKEQGNKVWKWKVYFWKERNQKGNKSRFGPKKMAGNVATQSEQEVTTSSGSTISTQHLENVTCTIKSRGETTVICGTGVVNLENGLKLKRVMHIPSFKHNLLSVQKLNKEENVR
ncbi:hypothetical protein RDABS01_026657 [Bienertia sinuspersici]